MGNHRDDNKEEIRSFYVVHTDAIDADGEEHVVHRTMAAMWTSHMQRG